MVVKDEKYLLISAPSPTMLIDELNKANKKGFDLFKISDDWCEAIVERKRLVIGEIPDSMRESGYIHNRL